MPERASVYRFTIRWPVGRDDLLGVVARLGRELDGRAPGIVVCNLAACRLRGAIDAVAVDALARLAIEARRRRWALRLQDVPTELAGLIGVMGLAPVLLPARPAEPRVPGVPSP